MSFEISKESYISNGEFLVSLCLGHRVPSYLVTTIPDVSVRVLVGELSF